MPVVSALRHALTAQQALALGALVLGMLTPEGADDDASMVRQEQASIALASPRIQWEAHPLPALPEVFEPASTNLKFKVPDVCRELIYDDCDYPHLFDPAHFAEAFAFQESLGRGDRVTLIYACEDMVVRVVIADESECSAIVDAVPVSPEQASALVTHWKDECINRATHRARDILSLIPRDRWRDSLSALVESFGFQIAPKPAASETEATIDSLERVSVDGITFAAAEARILRGICDIARRRHGLGVATDAEEVAKGCFWDLRSMIGGSEFPEGDEDRLYLHLPPFDVRLKRESEGLVVDVFAGETAESIATTYALFSDAEQESEVPA